MIGEQVIMATNRADTLDPALLRPGRLDRKIEFPLPSRREKRLIFQTVSSKMSISADVDLEDCMSSGSLSDFVTDLLIVDVQRPDKLSAADIAAICQAAGLQGEPRSSSLDERSADRSSCLQRCGRTGSFSVLACSLQTLEADDFRLYRYVILPVDFDAAWAQTVKTSDDRPSFYQ